MRLISVNSSAIRALGCDRYSLTVEFPRHLRSRKCPVFRLRRFDGGVFTGFN
jgi:hypothetical protein